jgi:beta-fructofuranosidase
VKDSDLLSRANISIRNGHTIAENCPLRPQYHFIAPAYWMNDINGPIHFKGEYHLFYQHNPFSNDWGDMFWGHAKSKDLIEWTYLPIALGPSKSQGESGCWSGSCVVRDGIPSILYTSIGPTKPPSMGAEQWLAVSKDKMITWEKVDENPVMKCELSTPYEVKDWRDPFLWKNGDWWYAILSGHLNKPRRPLVLLYKSKDLKRWFFLKPLLIEDKTKGKNWECPNFFSLKDKHILIVSPHDKVLYNIGIYKNETFFPGEWEILDHGSLFYATNILKETSDHVILWAWIKAVGTIGWKGCLTLPRIVSLNVFNQLEQYPHPSLKQLRIDHILQREIEIKSNEPLIFPKFEFKSSDIYIEIKSPYLPSFELNAISENLDEAIKILNFDEETNIISLGREKALIKPDFLGSGLKLRLLVDHSIFELFINKRISITTQIAQNFNDIREVMLYSGKSKLIVNTLKIWNLKSIKKEFYFKNVS